MQYHPVYQEGWSRAKGNQISQRVKFAPEGAFVSAHAGDAAVEQVKNAGQQNEAKCDFNLAVIAKINVGLHNPGERNEAAE